MTAVLEPKRSPVDDPVYVALMQQLADWPDSLDINDLNRLTTLGKSTIWRLESAGRIPKATRIEGARRVFWPKAVIVLWLAAKQTEAASVPDAASKNAMPDGDADHAAEDHVRTTPSPESSEAAA